MRTKSFSLVLFLSIAVASNISAQSGQAALTGEIRDQAGAVVSGAKVTVTQLITNQSFTVTTTDAGIYTVTNLRPGIYSVGVEAQGFKSLLREGVKLTTGEQVRVDATLEPGTISDRVTITSDAS